MDDEDGCRPGEAGYLVQRFLQSEVSQIEFDRSGILFFPTKSKPIYPFEGSVEENSSSHCISSFLGISLMDEMHPQKTRVRWVRPRVERKLFHPIPPVRGSRIEMNAKLLLTRSTKSSQPVKNLRPVSSYFY
jgi:hypothetical protein